jgi:TRAP-type C4-dicarboxylate transport system substrate-binding protein
MFTEVTLEAAARGSAKIKKREAELIDTFKKRGLPVVEVNRKSFQDTVLKKQVLGKHGAVSRRL